MAKKEHIVIIALSKILSPHTTAFACICLSLCSHRHRFDVIADLCSELCVKMFACVCVKHSF